MRFSFVLTLALSANLLAYTDSDLDGVEDALDQCPETLLNELVNAQGCTIKSLEHHYDIIVGAGYSQLNYISNQKEDTFTTTLQADYYTKNVSAQIIASHYISSNDSGMNDTLVAGYYQFPLDNQLSLKIGGGILLPTYETGYNNESSDYMGSLAVTYLADPKIALIGGYSYTFVKDADVAGALAYQNSEAYYVGVNYLVDTKLSVGSIYQNSDSIYRDVEPIEKISAYAMIRFDAHWFGNANYTYGLSDSASDHALDLRIGYSF